MAGLSGDGERRDFFVSYTAADRDWAEWISWQLEDAGYSVLVREWDMVPGVNWLRMMNEATRTAERTIAVLSVRYLTDSAFGEPEWLAAYHRDPSGLAGRLIPVRVEECAPDGLLAGIFYADLVGLNDKDAAKETLLEAVRAAIARRSKPLVEPSFPGAVEPRATAALSGTSHQPRVRPNTATATNDRSVAASGSATDDGAPMDRRRIIGETTSILEWSDIVRDARTREMLLEELGFALGEQLWLPEASTFRSYLIQLSSACVDRTSGLRVLAECLELLGPDADRADALLRLADEWQTLTQFSGHDLSFLRTELLVLRLTPRLRSLAVDRYRVPVPDYCESAWHVFTHLASLPSTRAVPTWLRFLEHVAVDVPARSRPQLNELIHVLGAGAAE